MNTFLTYKEILAEFKKFYTIYDDYLLKMIVTAYIGNQLRQKIWLMIVGPSGSGKTEFIEMLEGFHEKTVFPVSDITPNTFLSGQKSIGKENSLLSKMSDGNILSFKEFTTIITKEKTSRDQILGQLREVYDGTFAKRTGNGQDTNWKAHIGCIAGGTDDAYLFLDENSSKGPRFVVYNFIDFPKTELDRTNIAKQAMRNTINKKTKQAYYREMIYTYCNEILDKGDIIDETILSDEMYDTIANMAEFATRARTGVIRDDRNPDLIKHANSHEMPTRMAEQLMSIASTFAMMNRTEREINGEDDDGNYITEEDIKVISKIAFDSIPVTRQKALIALAEFTEGVSTSALANKTQYDPKVVKRWLSELAVLGICTRENIGLGDKWILKEQHRNIIVNFLGIKVVKGELVDDADRGHATFTDDTGEMDIETKYHKIDTNFTNF